MYVWNAANAYRFDNEFDIAGRLINCWWECGSHLLTIHKAYRYGISQRNRYSLHTLINNHQAPAMSNSSSSLWCIRRVPYMTREHRLRDQWPHVIGTVHWKEQEGKVLEVGTVNVGMFCSTTLTRAPPWASKGCPVSHFREMNHSGKPYLHWCIWVNGSGSADDLFLNKG